MNAARIRPGRGDDLPDILRIYNHYVRHTHHTFDTLEPRVADDSLHRAYAVIALPNPGSIAFHERFGFHHVGTLHEAGSEFDRWWDIAWYEKDLAGPAIL